MADDLHLHNHSARGIPPELDYCQVSQLLGRGVPHQTMACLGEITKISTDPPVHQESPLGNTCLLASSAGGSS